MLINPLISGSWESLGSQQALGMAVSIMCFHSQWGWTCVCVYSCPQCEAHAFLRPAQPQGPQSGLAGFLGSGFPEEQGGTEPAGSRWKSNCPQEMVEAGLWVCSPDQMAVYRLSFLCLQLCLSEAQRALGDQPAGPQIPVGPCHAARPTKLLSVSGLWHPQLKCLHQKTAGTEGNSSYPS